MQDDKKKKTKIKQRDEVSEASRESFPASDSPAYWAAAPGPVKKRPITVRKDETVQDNEEE